MIYNQTTSGSVPEQKNIDKHAKKYTAGRSGRSSDAPTPAKKKVVATKPQVQIKVTNGRLEVIKK